jgi:hypothetical protein
MYHAMRYHFDEKHYPGIVHDAVSESDAAQSESMMDGLYSLRDLEQTYPGFRVKFAAALARIRIERRASGPSLKEMISNMLPEELRQKEELAGDRTIVLNTDHLWTCLSIA